MVVPISGTLAVAGAHLAAPVADDDQGAEAEAAAALHGGGGAVDADVGGLDLAGF
jgi:hypothetical protein